jgi:hypothetical protein
MGARQRVGPGVDFYYGDGWIGWAPLPPGAGFGASFSFGIQPRHCVFVEERYFVDGHIDRWTAPVHRNRVLLCETANVTRFSRVGDAFVNSSLPVERIARVTRREVPTHRVVDVGGDPRAALGVRPRTRSADVPPGGEVGSRRASAARRPRGASVPFGGRAAGPRASRPRAERASGAAAERPARAGQVRTVAAVGAARRPPGRRAPTRAPNGARRG